MEAALQEEDHPQPAVMEDGEALTVRRLREELATTQSELEACRRERDELLRHNLRLRAKCRALKYHRPPSTAAAAAPTPAPTQDPARHRPLQHVVPAPTIRTTPGGTTFSSSRRAMAASYGGGYLASLTWRQQQQQAAYDETRAAHRRKQQAEKKKKKKKKPDGGDPKGSGGRAKLAHQPATTQQRQRNSKLIDYLATSGDVARSSSTSTTLNSNNGISINDGQVGNLPAAGGSSTVASPSMAQNSGRRLLAGLGLETSASAALTSGAGSVIDRPREGDVDSVRLLGAAHRAVRLTSSPPPPAADLVKPSQQRSEESGARMCSARRRNACVRLHVW